MRDGSTVEAVLMLDYDRATVCVSSQVGCAMGCNFCATGQMGFTRNLSAGEILEQVLWFNRWLREHPHVPKIPYGTSPQVRSEGPAQDAGRECMARCDSRAGRRQACANHGCDQYRVYGDG